MHACEQFTDKALPKIFPQPLPTGALDHPSFQRKGAAELTDVLEGLPQLCELAQGLLHHTCCPLVHSAVLVGVAPDGTLDGLGGQTGQGAALLSAARHPLTLPNMDPTPTENSSILLAHTGCWKCF